MSDSNKDRLNLYSGKSGMTLNMKFSGWIRFAIGMAIFVTPFIPIIHDVLNYLAR